MGLAAPPNQPPAAPPIPAPPGLPNQQVLRQVGFLYPRWPFLAAFLLTPFIALGYGLEVWYGGNRHPCAFGALCTLDTLPGVLQVALIWLAFVLLWVFMLIFGVAQGIAGASQSARSPLASWLRDVSEVERIRWPLAIVGALVAVGLAAGWLRQVLDVPAVAFGGIGLVVGLTALFYQDRPPQAPADPQDQLGNDLRAARGFWGVLRSIPPFVWLFPVRATPPQNAGNAGGQNPPTP
ncbi:MAG TPA: hypothetical protein VMV29_00170 [Ktedonobacterales bacterium]|nr:hypothetical protein [Ktedonobacterales bacterium]